MMVESIGELRKICVKSGPSQIYNRLLRPVSIYVTKILLYTPITANHVTIFMIMLGVFGSAMLFMGYFAFGLILLHMTVLLDDVDGEIARYRKSMGFLGKFIDEIFHAVTTPLMFFGFAFGVYKMHPNDLLLVFGFLSAVFSRSVVMPAIFDVIASQKIRGTMPQLKKVSVGDVAEFEGQAKRHKNLFIRLYHFLRNIWAFPSSLVLLTVLYIWEVINLSYGLVPEFAVSVFFFVIFGTYVTLNQVLSFTFHTRKNSIDSFYAFLFGRK